jgi:hypothetical protein
MLGLCKACCCRHSREESNLKLQICISEDEILNSGGCDQGYESYDFNANWHTSIPLHFFSYRLRRTSEMESGARTSSAIEVNVESFARTFLTNKAKVSDYRNQSE